MVWLGTFLSTVSLEKRREVCDTLGSTKIDADFGVATVFYKRSSAADRAVEKNWASSASGFLLRKSDTSKSMQ